jgi:formamidopyrimidine-DNA glycosylase
MPELPEVETVARQLRPVLTGRRVERLRILDPLLRTARVPPLAGRRIESVRRSGKQVLIGFGPRDRGDAPLWLAVHLRMTGRLLWTDESGPDERAHLRARFALDRGRLLFRDTRRFGTFRWFDSERAAAPAGIDPLDPALDAGLLQRLVAGARQNAKAWLLRQDRLVGLGNIYASEILHAAGIDPRRDAGSLDARAVARLHAATRRILRRAIDACGTTFSDFQDARGVEGGYQRYLRVYGREGERCRRCRGLVVRAVQQQRSTFWCPGCQR